MADRCLLWELQPVSLVCGRSGRIDRGLVAQVERRPMSHRNGRRGRRSTVARVPLPPSSLGTAWGVCHRSAGIRGLTDPKPKWSAGLRLLGWSSPLTELPRSSSFPASHAHRMVPSLPLIAPHGGQSARHRKPPHRDRGATSAPAGCDTGPAPPWHPSPCPGRRPGTRSRRRAKGPRSASPSAR